MRELLQIIAQPLLTRLHQCLEGSTRAHGKRPVCVVDQAMQLNEIQVIGAQELERAILTQERSSICNRIQKVVISSWALPAKGCGDGGQLRFW